MPSGLDGDAFQKDMEWIDTRAQKYYDYFCEYGEFPDEGALPVAQSISMETYSVTEQSSLATDMLYAAAVDASVINQFGYAFTASAVAMHLAEIGSAIAMSSALPYVALICAVAGAAILAIDVAIAIANHTGTFEATTRKHYTKSEAEIRDATITTADVIQKKNQGYIYWICERIERTLPNGDEMRGVALIDTITKVDAKSIVAQNNPYGYDIYSLYKSDTVSLAKTITGYFEGP